MQPLALRGDRQNGVARRIGEALMHRGGVFGESRGGVRDALAKLVAQRRAVRLEFLQREFARRLHGFGDEHSRRLERVEPLVEQLVDARRMFADDGRHAFTVTLNGIFEGAELFGEVDFGATGVLRQALRDLAALAHKHVFDRFKTLSDSVADLSAVAGEAVFEGGEFVAKFCGGALGAGRDPGRQIFALARDDVFERR